MIKRVVTLVVVGLVSVSAACQNAQAEQVSKDKYEKTVSKGIQYLTTKGQAEDGSFSSRVGIGPTALATTALLRHGRTVEDPSVAKAIDFILKHVQPDGGIYVEGSRYRNYETCVAMTCLIEADQIGKYDKLIKNAEGFVKGLQWDKSEGKDESDPAYGGAGYGRHKRPDLSNTQFFIDALKAAGNGPDDPAIKRALIFVSRCQNLETEHNTTPHAAKNPDGGFYYTAAAGGESQAGETPTGGLRSYASMTYAGLKSMIYAGVDKDDPRVKAAYKWAQKHYDLEENPGMGPSGLFYYYQTFAKTLEAVGNDTITTADGEKRNWRADLVNELAERQQEDGSWINTSSERWLEGDPNLVTAYSLLALSYCKP